MAAGLAAAGELGLAKEVTPGTYVTPAKWIPILSESLEMQHSVIKRRPIRGLVDVVGAVVGPQHVTGSIQFEVTHSTLPWIMQGMRGAAVKSGVGPYLYTFTPNANIQPASHLSFTIVRNAIVFGYVGCVVSSLQLTMQNEIMVATVGIVGWDEAVQSNPSETWPTEAPIGVPGDMVVEIPTAAQVYDTDQFTFNVNDNAEPQFRLRDNKVTPTFIKYGEREMTLSLERDFDARTDYDAFKLATAQSITIKATTDANNYVHIIMDALVKDSYAVGLSGQGELVRGSIEYGGVYSAANSRSYQLLCSSSTESIT
jgi:hypothetical protein